MEDYQERIALFANSARQLMLRYKELKQENQRLCAMLDERDLRISQLESQLAQSKRDYDSLKMAKMINVSDDDIAKSKQKLQHIIHNIDKCITLLSEKQ